MVTIEKHTSSSLGYLNIPRASSKIIAPPINADDAGLHMLCQQFNSLATPEARKKFEEEIYDTAQTPRAAAFKALRCIRTKFESNAQSMILYQLSNNNDNHPQTSISASSCSSSSTSSNFAPDASRNPNKIKNERHSFLFKTSAFIGNFIAHEIPVLAAWNPSLTDKRDLFSTAYLHW